MPSVRLQADFTGPAKAGHDVRHYVELNGIWTSEKSIEDRPQALGGLLQLFGNHARLADRGHETAVAVPARQEMNVDVIDNASASCASNVDAHIDAVRPVRLGEGDFGKPSEPHQLRQLSFISGGERGDVPPRNHH